MSYTIDYSIYIKDKSYTTKSRGYIESIEIEERFDGSDSCTIKISDPTFTFIGDTNIRDNSKVKVYFNQIDGKVRRINTFEGYISAIDCTFPDSGTPTMSIFCLDTSQPLDRVKKSRTWTLYSTGYIVRQLAKEYGLKLVIEKNYTFAKEETTTQSKQSDLSFLESLPAKEKDEFLFKIVGKTMYYIKKNYNKTPKKEISYKGPHMINFKPKLTKKLSRVPKVKKPKKKTTKKK